MSWSQLSDWWLGEIAGDSAYEEVVTPLLLEVLNPRPGRLYLDLGSGEGRVLRAVTDAGAIAHGVELNFELAARSHQPVIIAELPSLSFIATDSYDGAYCVLSLEHIEDHVELFRQVADVVQPDGVLAIVMNHPLWTAPGSTPITDTDGEVLWRPGEYFSNGTTEEPAGDTSVNFHHRTMATLLTAAASVSWSLEAMVERPHHDLEDQAGIPRLQACRWRLLR